MAAAKQQGLTQPQAPGQPAASAVNNPYTTTTAASPGYGMNHFGAHGAQTVTHAGSQSSDPYRSDLQTSFQGAYDPSSASGYTSYNNDSDSDVRQAQNLTSTLSQAHAGLNGGVDQVATQAQLDAVKARIGLKNSLGQSIAGNDANETSAEGILKGDANQSLASGLKNTNQNYNSRGLLFSGMREGADNQVRAGTAANLASGLAGTKEEYSNLKQQQQQAYATIGAAQQQQNVDRAKQTFDTVNQNNIARAQATQQLAGGLGQVAGMAYSSYNKSPQTNYDSMNPNNNNYQRLQTTTLSEDNPGLLGPNYDANSRTV